jgi:hypothetical protein
MNDLRDRLRRASELVSPLEPAYQRLLRRQERHARNVRLVSASFALVLTAVVLAGVFATLGGLGSMERDGDRFGPAPGDEPGRLALGPGEYFYEKISRILPEAEGITPGTVVVETWWSPDASGRREATTSTPSVSYSPGPTGRWDAGGFPVLERDLSSLSTDPDELVVQLRERSAPGGASPQPSITPGPGLSVESGSFWRAVNDLLEMPNAVPELRAALFRVTAAIPGVRVVENTSDPAGRQAVALSFRSEGADRELFFDPRTLQFMAKVENYGAGGTWYLIVDRAGIVDSIDERPEGQELLFEPRIPGPQSPPVPESPPIPTFAPTPPIRPGEPIPYQVDKDSVPEVVEITPQS